MCVPNPRELNFSGLSVDGVCRVMQCNLKTRLFSLSPRYLCLCMVLTSVCAVGEPKAEESFYRFAYDHVLVGRWMFRNFLGASLGMTEQKEAAALVGCTDQIPDLLGYGVEDFGDISHSTAFAMQNHIFKYSRNLAVGSMALERCRVTGMDSHDRCIVQACIWWPPLSLITRVNDWSKGHIIGRMEGRLCSDGRIVMAR